MRPSSRSRRERVISRARATLSAARPSPAAASPPSTFRALPLCRAEANAQPDCAAGAAHAAWRASSQKTFERQSRFAPLRDRQQPLVSTCGRGELHAERHFVVRHRDRDGDGGKSEQRPQRATRRVSGLSEFPRRRRRCRWRDDRVEGRQPLRYGSDQRVAPRGSSVGLNTVTPWNDSTSTVGLKPTTPQYAAGRINEPLVCVPIAAGTCPSATAAAEPDDEPPGVYPARHGFLVLPGWTNANSVVTVLPSTNPPARRSRSMQSASYAGRAPA